MTSVSADKDGVFEFLEDYRHQNKHSIEQSLNEIILSYPFGNHPFYVFCFLKKNMKGDGNNTMYYQPRLTKPEPMDNTMLFRCKPGDPEHVEVMWILPNEESIKLFKQGKMFEDELIHSCIKQYLTNPASMRKPEFGDVPDYLVKEIYKQKYKIKTNASILF